ncbi:uncharacterized protein LOC143450604 [Clavelina lepadiformis]|uniref:uncharacterized protein LOC143450604 n=1 Tax=Clavelina lepadiformis TaxID=159417 RepID=UPI004042E198
MNATDAINKTNDVYDLPFTTWIIYEVFSVILTTIAVYICAMLIHYSCVKNVQPSRKPSKGKNPPKADKEAANNSNSIAGGRKGSNSSAEGGPKKRSDGTGRSAKPLRVLCLCASIFALLRILSDQLELATYGSERVDCKVYQVIVVVTYALSATFNYSALWVRLRIFIAHPVMKHLASKLVRCLTWFALVAIIASALLNTLIFTLTSSAVDSKLGCKLGHVTSISPTARYVILTVSTVVTQGLLLSLFLYPLVKHKTTMKKNNMSAPPHPRVATLQSNITRPRVYSSKSDSDSEAVGSRKKNQPSNGRMSVRKSKKANRQKRLMVIIRRVLITAIICVASDVITAIITLAFGQQPRVVSNMVFNLNLLINILSVLFSFGDWQERLIPCCASELRKRKKRKRLASGASNGTIRVQLEAEESAAKIQKRIESWRHNQDSTGSAPVRTPSPPHSAIELKNDDVFL